MERKKPVFERDSGHPNPESQTEENVIGKLIADTFRPTESQRKAKAALLAFLSDPETMLFDLKSLVCQIFDFLARLFLINKPSPESRLVPPSPKSRDAGQGYSTVYRQTLQVE